MFKSIEQESIISDKPYDLLSFYSEPLQFQEQFSYFEYVPKSLDELMPQEPLKKPRKKRKKQINYLQKRIRKPNGTQKPQKPKISSQSTFSYQEDELILQSVLSLGPKFDKIAQLFPTKTLHMVKNRYYKTLRFQWDGILGDDFKHLNSLKESSIDQNLQDIYKVKNEQRKKTEISFQEDFDHQSQSNFLIDSLIHEENGRGNDDFQFI